MMASQLVPGIDAYPEMEKQLNLKLRRNFGGGCGSCDTSELARKYRERLRLRVLRDNVPRKS